ncbi:MAG: polysaccharide deacetylase family protein [Candidatus Hodarchaeota archaeon]
MTYRKYYFKRIAKRVFCSILFYLGITNLIIILLKKLDKGKHCVLILLYHRFSHHSKAPHLLPYMHVEDFRRHMSYIRKWYEIISLDELIDNLNDNKKFTTPRIILTFDDGYKSNYTLAYPILRNLNLPATIFLTSGLIGSEKGLWVDELENILLYTPVKKFALPEIFKDEVLSVNTLKQKREIKDRLRSHLLYADNNTRRKYINKLRKILKLENDTIKMAKDRIMLNWEEIREMAAHNITFGGHTLSHPALTCIPFPEAANEIIESKNQIERHLGLSVRHFAVPNGEDNDFNESLSQFCKEIGFKSIASANHGLIDNTNKDPYWLKRISASPSLPVFAFDLLRYLFLSHSSP